MLFKQLLPAALVSAAMLGAATSASAADPASVVDPLIGTANGGNVFPGADTPFGMVQFSPDETNGNQAANVNSSGYADGVNRIRGFGLAHVSGAGCGGLAGDVPFMPYVGDVTTSPAADVTDAKYSSRFVSADQSAKAGVYSVKLDSGVKAELSATTRTAAGRFTYPSQAKATMLVRTSAGLVGSSDAGVTIDPATRTISGSVMSGNFCGNKNLDGNPDRTSYYTLYFVAKFDAAFNAYGTWKDGAVSAGSTSASGGTSYAGGSSGGVSTAGGNPTPGKGSGAYVQFDTSSGQPVGVRVGVSYVDPAGAQANLDAEQPAGTSFDTVAQRAHDAWNTALGHIDVQGGTAAQQKVFYTALYHSLLHMNVFSDVDGRYRGMDQQTHTVAPGQAAQYATFSGWDIYRSQVQLVSLLDPAVASDMAQSLLNQSTQDVDGRWDRWTHNSGAVSVMSGDPSPAFVDTVLAFGGTNWDTHAALQSLVKAATVPTPADLSHVGWMNTAKGERPSLDQFLALHYFPNPSNAWSGASETLEDSTADFAIADLAQRLGDGATHDAFMNRAQYWQNVFNVNGPGYMQNRAADGTWPGLDAANGADFAEGSPTQYVWNIPFNVAGLFAAMGGPQTAAARLDAYFHNGSAWAFTGAGGLHPELNNEPSLWAPWLFAWSGAPAKTQQVVRQIEDTLWTTTTRGIPGNDDLGTMSAWYVFAALGMYPEIPGRAEMVLGSPEFTKAVIHRASGQTLTIDASGTGPFVAGVQLDGADYAKPWLAESFIAGDHTLDYQLTDSAAAWGAGSPPPSFRAGEQPVLAALDTQSFQLDPGAGASATLTLQNTSDAPQTVTLNAAPSAHVTVTGGPITLPAGARVSAPIVVHAAAGTPLGTTELANLGVDGVVAKVAIDNPKPLAALYNGVGQRRDADTALRDALDSSGHSFSREALAAAGVTPGGTVSVGGFTYTWPAAQEGERDNYVAAGDRIALGDAAGATRIGVLGTATNGPSRTTATVAYSDGSTSQSTLQFGDWVSGNGNSQPTAGDRRAAAMTYRTTPSGTENASTTLYSAAIALDPGKLPVSLSISAPGAGLFHVFALALDKRGPLPLAQLFDQAGIARDAFHAEASLDWTGHALSWEALAARGVTPGSTVHADGLDYTWPAQHSPDNMEVAGQRIALDPYEGATKIGLLATAIKGPADTVATVAYTDGSTADTPLQVSDWTPGAVQPRNTTVIDTTYRDTTAGTDTTHADVYSVTVPVVAGRRPAWIRLSSPTSGNAAIHVFAVAEDGKLVVSTSAGGDTGAAVPATLALTLGAPASFGAFTPGVAADYTAATTANVISTAGDAALGVSDPGHLANGGLALPSPLEVSIAPATWTGPVSNAAVAISFKQHVGATDALRTGAYTRTLTFTLSTTSP